MNAKKNKYTYGLAAAVALGACQFASPAMAFSTGSYDLFNHPDAALTDAPNVVYGLRLDAICNIVNCGSQHTDDEKTFSVDKYENGGYTSKLWLDWAKSDSGDPNLVDYTTARIHGELWYNDKYPYPSSAGSKWTVEYNLENIEAISGADPTTSDPGNAINGWRVTARNTSGTLTRVGDGLTIQLKGKNQNGGADDGYAFIFDDDGHRCNTTTGGDENYGNFNNGQPSKCEQTDANDPLNDTEITATGWLKLKYNGYWYKNGTNDWITIAESKDPTTEISEPGTLALFGAGLLGLGYARRRRLKTA